MIKKSCVTQLKSEFPILSEGGVLSPMSSQTGARMSPSMLPASYQESDCQKLCGKPLYITATVSRGV